MGDRELTITVCALLGRIPGWAWRPDGPAYTSAEVAVMYGALPGSPDRAVGVRVYSPLDDPARHVRARRVQLRIRGAKNRVDGADELADIAFSALAAVSRVDGISGITRPSFSPLGADGNARQERTDNYIVLLDNQEAQP